MAGRRGSDLANRFKGALDAQTEAAAQAQAAAAARQVREVELLGELMADLEAFGQAVGLVVARSPEGVVLRRDDRELAFRVTPQSTKVVVLFAGAEREEHFLYLEPQIGDRWVWVRKRITREDRKPLFDAGLGELLIIGLDMPKPAGWEPEAYTGTGRWLKAGLSPNLGAPASSPQPSPPPAPPSDTPGEPKDVLDRPKRRL